MENRTFVFIRYSIFTQKKGGWVIGRDTESNEYKDALFSDSRLEMHEKLFTQVTLPSIANSINDNNVVVFVFTSKCLPDKFKNNLYDLKKKYSWLEVVELPSDDGPITMMDSYFKEYLRDNFTDLCYATVRLDDDDAVSNSYFDNLNTYIHPKFNKMAITWPMGYRGLFIDHSYKKFAECEQMKCAQGLAYIARYSEGKYSKPLTVFSLGHHAKVDQRVPLIVDKSTRAYLRTVHEESDVYSSASGIKFNDNNLVEPDQLFEHITFDF